MNLSEAIKIIQYSNPKQADILNLKNEVAQKTNNFSNQENISRLRYDITPYLIKNGINPQSFQKKYGSVKRSEYDVVLHLANLLQKDVNTKQKQVKQSKERQIAPSKNRVEQSETAQIRAAIKSLKAYAEIVEKAEQQSIKKAISDLKNYLNIL